MSVLEPDAWRDYSRAREQTYTELFGLAERVSKTLAVEESDHGFPFNFEARQALADLRAFLTDGDDTSASGSIQQSQEGSR